MTKIQFGYTKTPLVSLKALEESQTCPISLEDEENNYRPCDIDQLQQYQPIYSLFFDMTENNYNSIQLNHRYHIVDMETVMNVETKEESKRPIFIKYSPLFDPIKFMVGKYGESDRLEIKLPSYSLPRPDPDTSAESLSQKKLASFHNASYVDGFFYFLSSKLLQDYGFKHGLNYYGSYLGIQKQYKMNIVDDYNYLINSTFFNNNLNKLFKTTNQDFIHSLLNNNSRANRQKLNICVAESTGNQVPDHDASRPIYDMLGVEELTEQHVKGGDDDDRLEDVYEKSLPDKPLFDFADDSSSDSDNNYSSDEDPRLEDSEDNSDVHDEENMDNDDDDDAIEIDTEFSDNDSEVSSEPQNIYAYIQNFPVQMICLERCDGTLDELFDSGKMDEMRSASALFQVVMTLIAYQKAFNFTHNDLHTNNIMYVKTTKEYLFYKYQRKIYRVPTFGKIFKIIDFGRSIYHFRGHRFCSDSFGPGGDAATQYNCEPYFNENKPRIEPNYSFDLCRLGTSIFDFIFDIDDPNHDKNMTPFQSTILRWCSDDMGKNVLYKRNGEERYPKFKLYKMIARNVHQHTPDAQLEYPFFKQFEYPGKHLKPIKNIINIDLLPKV